MFTKFHVTHAHANRTPLPVHGHSLQYNRFIFRYIFILLNATSIWFIDECGFKIEDVSTNDTFPWRLQMSSSGAAYTYALFDVTIIRK
jgi:hypothetical protein